MINYKELQYLAIKNITASDTSKIEGLAYVFGFKLGLIHNGTYIGFVKQRILPLTKKEIEHEGREIITVDEFKEILLKNKPSENVKSFPREMFVRKDENSEWTIRTVIGINPKNIAIALYYRVNLSNVSINSHMYFWNFYREIDDKIEVSMKEIAKKFNIPIDSIKIID